MKKFLIITAIVLLVMIGGLLTYAQIGSSFTDDAFTEIDYSHIMRDNISGDPRITDVAMLAAHDAFSYNIPKVASVNYNEKDGVLAGDSIKFLTRPKILQTLIGGFIQRISVAQKSDTYSLAVRGVRYFDMRIAEYDGGFYGCHGMISGPIEEYITGFLKFLESAEGEFIVLEFRHSYFDKAGYPELFEYIENIRYNGRNIFDYVHYDSRSTLFSELSYLKVTDGGTKAGVVMVLPEISDCVVLLMDESMEPLIYPPLYVPFTSPYAYNTLPYAVWHNQTKDEKMLSGIRETVDYIEENIQSLSGVFRINQAQKTPKFERQAILDAVFGWSLLDMAERFNGILLEQPDFDEWLRVMPVFQTDYTDSMKDGFNDRVIERINAYNSKLA